MMKSVVTLAAVLVLGLLAATPSAQRGWGWGDRTVPTVALTAPAAGATVSGTVALAAAAKDNVRVAGVTFYVDGAQAGSEDRYAPYGLTWDSTTAANGQHVIGARARDASGNRSALASVAVAVSNAPKPCSIALQASAPASATVGYPAAFTASATASNCAGQTAYVWTFGDGTSATGASASHAYTAAGSYAWSVTATNGSASASKAGTVAAADASVPPPGGGPAVIGPVGSFADASGHSAQSHLVYARNAGAWWAFALTSAADGRGGSNHVVQAWHSSGPDLATATWSPAGPSPGAQAAAYGFMSGGRALAVAYLDNAPADVVHLELAMAADGSNGRLAHIRAKLTATNALWEAWSYRDEPAATWTLPRAGALGISAGKFVHSANPILQQEVDANARRSVAADAGDVWLGGFGSVSVIDNSMINACNAFAFAPVAGEQMLAVYDNGGGTSTCYNCGQQAAAEPNLTNLNYRRSRADGTWPGVSVGGQGAGDGKVFPADATVDQNDWALASAPFGVVALRRNGQGLDAALYDPAANAWRSLPRSQPVAAKPGAGVFAAATGSAIRAYVIDATGAVVGAGFDGAVWTPWTVVVPANASPRSFLSGFGASDRVGLIWTEGGPSYLLVAAAVK